ncbi:MAG: S1C family serine protease [Anaerolineales bacterium]
MKQWISFMFVMMLVLSTSAVLAETPPSVPAISETPQEEGRLSLPDLYDRVSPGVVFIQVRNFGDDAASQFFPSGGLGSGFVYDTQGHIVTNHHVVEGATNIDVVFQDGTQARAEIIGTDPDSDLAVIRAQDVPVDRLVPLELGDSGAVRVGEEVVAIGNPFGQTWTMTRGIISAVGRANRAQTGFSIAEMIQTDAAMNRGNSGGPLLNLRGEVIGVNTMIFTETNASSGVGFSVPVNTVRRVAPELIVAGEYDYTWIGITGGDLNLDIIELMNLPRDTRGVLINDISQGGPAEAAGLRGSTDTGRINGLGYEIGGDVIIGIDGTPIVGIDELIGYLAENTRPGDDVQVLIIREGAETVIPVTLQTRPDRVP